jgi:hypothetical protein
MTKEETDKKPTKKTALEAARKLKYETMKTFSALLTSAFGLVAAFAWNETVKEVIDRYISSGSGLKSKLIYAIFVTLLAVFVSYWIGTIVAKYQPDDADETEK